VEKRTEQDSLFGSYTKSFIQVFYLAIKGAAYEVKRGYESEGITLKRVE
jgi:hypothetical protein